MNLFLNSAVTQQANQADPINLRYQEIKKYYITLRFFQTLVSARLVQSLVLGAYTLEQDPSNNYVSSTAKNNGWELLRRLRKTRPSPEEQDHTDWQAIADDYLTRS